ncbi:uncharacterized protein LOC118431714 [Branchiostoma floridae]|uniref:Uncharacterized protein LOC118431714 n=1 Tax=Branchiostoma floridae TaxID=7739 RepID=A0A9J7MDX0_BRAFL|nr:uncharacterized protein LOC118431714 [Branchiostoma floridae]
MSDVEADASHTSGGEVAGSGGTDSSEARRDRTESTHPKNTTEFSNKCRKDSVCLLVCSALVLTPGVILLAINGGDTANLRLILGSILLVIGVQILAVGCCTLCCKSETNTTDQTVEMMASGATQANVSGTGPTVITGTGSNVMVHPTTIAVMNPPGGATAPAGPWPYHAVPGMQYPPYSPQYTASLPFGYTPTGAVPHLPAAVQPNFITASAPPLEIPLYGVQPAPSHPPPPSYEEAVGVEETGM